METRARGIIFVEGRPVVRVSAFVNTKSILPPAASVVSVFDGRSNFSSRETIRVRWLFSIEFSFRNRPSGESILRYLFAETSNSIHPSRFEYQGGNIKKDGIELGDEGHKSLLSLIYRCQRGGKGHFFRYKNSHTEDGNLF